MRLLLRRARVVDASTSGDRGPARAVEPERPVDLVVESGRVVRLAAGVAPRPDDQVVDLAGRWVVPGLWDAHTHMSQWATTRQRLDVSAARSPAEAALLVTERLRSAPPPPGSVLVGAGFRDALWPHEPAAEVLDAAVSVAGVDPATPVVLVSGDLHCGWLSTSAARRFRLPAGGLLREHAWFAVLDRLGEAPTDVLDGWVRDAARAAAARGVVGVVDFERADAWRAWPPRAAGGPPDLRVTCAVWPESLDRVVAAGLRSGDPLRHCPALLTMGPLKVISDGSLNTRTAYCHDPYPGMSGSGARGELTVPPDELVPLLARATAAGLECAVHAIGDLAVSLAIDAFEATGARGRIEHAQLLDDDAPRRMAALGLVASVQPEHAMDDRDVADRLWAGRTGRSFAYRSLHRAGVRLALGSDAPVAPLDPWHAISAAVERSRDGRPAWHAEQALPHAVALAASTNGRTTVRAGDVADLAVLDADPLTASGQGLREMPVAATMLAGRWTHLAITP